MIKWIRDRPEQKPDPKGRGGGRTGQSRTIHQRGLRSPFAPWQPIPAAPVVDAAQDMHAVHSRLLRQRSDGCGFCHGLARCASAQNERADTKSCSNLRTSCPWPSWSSNLHHPHARKLLLPCSRRSSWPQALTLRRTREGMQDAHSSVSDRRSSSSAARTLFRRCSTPSCIGRFNFVTSCV